MSFRRRELLQMLSCGLGFSFILPGNGLEMAAEERGQAAGAAPGAKAAAGEKSGGTKMERVTGIGGFFFRAKDPKGLAQWYEQHLGILPIPTSYGASGWQQEAGPTAFAPFPESSKYFGDAQKVWMLNFRVRDLDKMAEQLGTAGIEVKIDPQSYPNGRFARLHDPEGNPIELWQPLESGGAH
jgi:catechol 2,3-dioxygenase-like lactoylglutathione lyase family enzyme